MARRRQLDDTAELIRRTLQRVPELRPLIIPNARPTGRVLRSDAYWSVEKLEIDGVLCAGKRIYDILIDPENECAPSMVDKHYKECQLLSDLRHPHIAQFLGVCFLPDAQLPLLVMEHLECTLDELLENTPNIPLFTKLSILQDVCRGLVYLHGRRPAVILGDLSAINILLTSAMTAKIFDMGNSQIVNISPGQSAQVVTIKIPCPDLEKVALPGALMYMPPEVFQSSRYGLPLDMFSFGVVALFTATQVFPGDPNLC